MPNKTAVKTKERYPGVLSHLNKAEQNILIETLNNSGIVIMPTDTIFGICAKASDRKAVQRIYKIKGRESKKPFVIIVASIRDTDLFNINISQKERVILNKVWPGPVSVILRCDSKELDYLHRGNKSLALRIPADSSLRKLLLKTGPLVATSANLSNSPVVKNIGEAESIFGSKIDLYISSYKKLKNKPSSIISISKGKLEIIRKGSALIRNLLSLNG